MTRDGEQAIKSISKCIRCGTCRSVCPVFEEMGWESSSTRGRMLVTKRLLEGQRTDLVTINSLNTCTTCGICTANCPAGVNPPELIEEARRKLVQSGLAINAHHELKDKVNLRGNVLGEASSRLGWLDSPARLVERPMERSDIVYFAGCLASYRYPEIAAKTFNVLRRFGATVLPDEKCCGSPLIRTGFDASQAVESNLDQINRLGASTVITGCAGCYTILKRICPKDIQVQSTTEFLAEHITELNLEHLDLTVTYHDPCHLGRHSGIYEQPRKVIQAICNLKEMKENRNKSRCCGGGGGVRAGYPELSLKLARRRLKDLPEGVDYIVTTCPLCIRNLNDAGAEGMAIDLVDLVDKAICKEKELPPLRLPEHL